MRCLAISRIQCAGFSPKRPSRVEPITMPMRGSCWSVTEVLLQSREERFNEADCFRLGRYEQIVR
jgi:hypothetical protein